MNRAVIFAFAAFFWGAGCSEVEQPHVQCITPKLGSEFGVVVRAEGAISGGDIPETKGIDPFYFTIYSVDGKTLDVPVRMEIKREFSGCDDVGILPKCRPIVIYGYETVLASGLPRDCYNIETFVRQDTSYHISNIFLLLKTENINAQSH